MKKMKNYLLVNVIFFLSFPLLASFEQTNRRYLSPIDIIIKLETTFPNREWKSLYEPYSLDSTVRSCSDLGANYEGTRKAAYGSNFSGTGEPGTPFPGASFLDEYIPCVKKYISSDLQVIDQAYSNEVIQASRLQDYQDLVESYLPYDYIEFLKTEFFENNEDQYRAVPENPQAFIHFYKEVKSDSIWMDRIIEHTIERILGPEPVILSFGFVSSQQELVNWVKSNLGNFTHTTNQVYNYETQTQEEQQVMTIKSVLEATLLLLTTREEFLTY